jgi:hypothetical protein
MAIIKSGFILWLALIFFSVQQPAKIWAAEGNAADNGNSITHNRPQMMGYPEEVLPSTTGSSQSKSTNRSKMIWGLAGLAGLIGIVAAVAGGSGGGGGGDNPGKTTDQGNLNVSW